MPIISVFTPTKANTVPALTVQVIGSSLPAGSTFTTILTVNAFSTTTHTTVASDGTLSVDVTAANANLGKLLSMALGGSWNDNGTSWFCGASDGTNSSSIAMSVD